MKESNLTGGLVQRSAVSVILGRERLDMRLPLIHIVANKYPHHKFWLPDMFQTHLMFR